MDFDVVVVGSGFGGAVCAARLAQAGYRVVILERGRRWTPDTFPRGMAGPWTWDHDNPVRRHGWFDLRRFPNMTVAQGAGVGGGSLVYANVSVEAAPDTFDDGWPPEVTFDGLAPHYARVGEMLQVRELPPGQWTARTRLLKEAAAALGVGARFRPLPLAVTFDDEWTYDQPDPHNPAKSRAVVNPQGVTQGTCVHLGDCDIGCEVRARNTLDLNYIPLAEQHGAEVWPLHLVRRLASVAGGYEVAYEEIAGDRLVGGTVTGRLAIVAAGSLGSTELLLRSRAAGGLPGLSEALGRRWSSNGDFLTPALHVGRSVTPTRGPTISAAVDLLDGAGPARGEAMFIEDGGLPDVADAGLRQLAAQNDGDAHQRALIASVRQLLGGGVLDCVMPWFAQSRDAADGRLSLEHGRLHLSWDPARSKSTIDAVAALHRLMAVRTGGIPLTPLTWTVRRDLITPHPLGGCPMAASPAAGVVDHRGEAFGCRNLYVADGAIVPKAIGLNPSRTIAALAERIAALIINDAR